MFRAGCVVLVLSALGFVSRSWSEVTKQPPAPRSKVAMVNLMQVIKNYKKFTAFQEDIKSEIEPFQKRDKEYKTQIEDLAKDLKDGELTADAREEIEAKLRKLRNKMEDNSEKAKKLLSKSNDKQMLTLYKEVHKAVGDYAKAHDLELVFHYNDAAEDSDEYWTPANVARKMQAGSAMPVYMAPGLDITKEIIKILNDKFRST
jgi:Skp family chaperone for outer membrane proteins